MFAPSKHQRDMSSRNGRTVNRAECFSPLSRTNSIDTDRLAVANRRPKDPSFLQKRESHMRKRWIGTRFSRRHGVHGHDKSCLHTGNAYRGVRGAFSYLLEVLEVQPTNSSPVPGSRGSRVPRFPAFRGSVAPCSARMTITLRWSTCFRSATLFWVGSWCYDCCVTQKEGGPQLLVGDYAARSPCGADTIRCVTTLKPTVAVA